MRTHYEVYIEDEDGELVDAQLLVNCTDEGVIYDIIQGDVVVATEAGTAQEITDRIMEEE
jgi:hypothetical protein